MSDAMTQRGQAVEWLLASDPAIRWQALRDIVGAPADVAGAERARVATEGWGAALLATQKPDGTFGHTSEVAGWGEDNPEWGCLVTLVWLRDLGIDPTSPEALRAVGLVRDRIVW